MAGSGNRSNSHGSLFSRTFFGLTFLAAIVVLILSRGDALSAESAASDQRYPAIAFDGTNYLIVWQDYRNGSWDIYGARVTPSGTVLDPEGIAISTGTGDQAFPALAFDGTDYLVVWDDSRLGSYHIYGTRVTKAGLVLDPSGFAVSSGPYDQRYPAIAFDGTNYLVVWEYDLNTGYSDVYGSRVTQAGLVLDGGNGIPISTATYNQSWPAVAFDGTNYLVVWGDYRTGLSTDIYGAFVTKGGVVLQPSGIAISTNQGDESHAGIAYSGSEYLVVWEYSLPSGVDIYGSRITPGGSILDPSGIAISTSIYDQRYPGVEFGGADFLVAWEDTRLGSFPDIFCARVNTGGTVLDPAGVSVSTGTQTEDWCAVAYSGTSYLIAWEDNRHGPYDIFAARVSTGGTVLDPGGFTDILFTSASARLESGGIVLSWQTTIHVATSNFVIERSDSRDGEFQMLNLPVSQVSALEFTCTDYSVSAGKTYWYKIILSGPSGEDYYGPIEASAAEIPAAYKIDEPFPNPFNPTCTIRYEIPRSGQVNLLVFDVSGSLVRTLVDGWREPGVYMEVWDGKGEDGSVLPSGVYLLRLEAAGFGATRKMAILR